uniref:Conserved plasma membrane protein n=1 Tax=Heterorhabditis bacteriophora TaxID=37862 RepID=A0A1I7X2Q9_HETBA
MVAIVVAFGCGIAFFPWSEYETSFDLIALTGFVIFLISGVLVHYLVLYAIHVTKFRLIVPFLIYHSFLIALNAITALIAVGELVSDQTPQVDEGEAAARTVLFIVPVICCVEAFMILLMTRCRLYLRNKRRHIRNGLPPCTVLSTNKEFIADVINTF